MYAVAFLEGMVTFISPCLLPMLPLYIAYFGGQRKGFANALFFVLGFSVVFVLLGAFAGSLGALLIRWKTPLQILAGALIILFGTGYLGWIHLPFFRGNSRNMDLSNMHFGKAFLFGVLFSVSWSPCVGPFLGTALMMAHQSGSAFKGMMMLVLYSLGLGIPFLFSALILDQLKEAFTKIQEKSDLIQKICGWLLIILGIFIATGLYDRVLSQIAGGLY